ncbi:DNA repair protein RadA, partial [Candidatus Hakubella thermalkaliphila]
MTKTKLLYVCRECGFSSPKWLGRCPDCSNWNSLAEEVILERKKTPHARRSSAPRSSPSPLISLDKEDYQDRLVTSIREFDRVMGGGLMPGSLVLVAGEPGIGKSTLLLQVAEAISQLSGTVLLVSGEESVYQLKNRARRLKVSSPNLFFMAETDLDVIEEEAKKLSPCLLIVDSIQTMYTPEANSSPGSILQVRESALRLMRLAKEEGLTTIIIGHVTKEGSIAGPRILEHLVDTVVYFEGERERGHRVLRVVKNRFGSTNEVGIFQMRSQGLVQVDNPSAVFLSERSREVSGSAIMPTLTGNRPILVEIQALAVPSSLSVPRRSCNGVEYSRVLLTIAVLERRVGLNLKDLDIYLNVAGGLRIVEPAADLPIAISVASSFLDFCVDPTTAILGEVGLGGEIRTVQSVAERVREAQSLGF